MIDEKSVSCLFINNIIKSVQQITESTFCYCLLLLCFLPEKNFLFSPMEYSDNNEITVKKEKRVSK